MKRLFRFIPGEIGAFLFVLVVGVTSARLLEAQWADVILQVYDGQKYVEENSVLVVPSHPASLDSSEYYQLTTGPAPIPIVDAAVDYFLKLDWKGEEVYAYAAIDCVKLIAVDMPPSTSECWCYNGECIPSGGSGLPVKEFVKATPKLYQAMLVPLHPVGGDLISEVTIPHQDFEGLDLEKLGLLVETAERVNHQDFSSAEGTSSLLVMVPSTPGSGIDPSQEDWTTVAELGVRENGASEVVLDYKLKNVIVTSYSMHQSVVIRFEGPVVPSAIYLLKEMLCEGCTAKEAELIKATHSRLGDVTPLLKEKEEKEEKMAIFEIAHHVHQPVSSEYKEWIEIDMRLPPPEAGKERQFVLVSAGYTEILEGQPPLLARKKLFLRGDANHDGNIDLSDSIWILSRLFLQSTCPPAACEDAIDANDDGGVDMSDAIRILSALFISEGLLSGAPEEDLSQDDLTCLEGS